MDDSFHSVVIIGSSSLVSFYRLLQVQLSHMLGRGVDEGHEFVPIYEYISIDDFMSRLLHYYSYSQLT